MSDVRCLDSDAGCPDAGLRTSNFERYSTVTLFARFRG
jgi:hypothetical protein